MKRVLFPFLLLALCFAPGGNRAYARSKVVSTEYIYQVPENLSPDQAREIAVTRARAQAIADEFGMTVSQRTSTLVENDNGNSTSDFMALGGSELKGEWIEDLENPVFEYITDGANIAIKVRIKGRIREVSASRVAVDTKILRNGVLDSNESEQFISGDDLYISLNSPVDGFAAIYIIDNSDNVFCLLPYQSQSEGIFHVKSNQKYIFFHPDYPQGVKQADIDSFIVSTDTGHERNRILIFFSPNRFFKAADSKLKADLPREMNIADFKKWMSNLVKKDPDLTITERAILITSTQQ